MQENKIKNLLVLHFIVFIWGFTAILGKLISIEAIPLVFLRMFLAVLFMLLYFIIKKHSFLISRKAILKFLLTGIIIALHWIFFFKAIKVSNISVALVTMSTGAFFTALLEPIFFKRKISLQEIFFGLLVIIGLYVIFNFENHFKLGILYALLASFLGALFSVLNGLFVKEYKATTITLYQLFFGVLFIAIYILFTSGITGLFFKVSTTDWLYLIILSSICTAYAFMASVKVMKFLSPYTVMLTTNLEPIYAILLALLIFGENEKMEATFYLGAVIVLGVVLVNGIIKNKNRRSRKLSQEISRKN